MNMASIQELEEDDTRRFVSKQNVALIGSMTQMSFKDARNVVIEWVRRHKGYIQSVSRANQELIEEIQGNTRPTSMPQRPHQTSQDTRDVGSRLQQMQMERDTLFKQPENRMISQQEIPKESREDVAKKTAERLEQMQKERSVSFSIVSPSPTHTASSVSMIFHSTHSQKKKGASWWEREWVVPELYTMAMASHIVIPHLVIQSKTRSNLRRLLVLIHDVSGGGSVYILTPSQQKLENIVEYKVIEEIHLGDIWTYHFCPVEDGLAHMDWNQKVERLEVQLVSMGDEMGRFWESDDIISWSLTASWKRP